MLKTRVRTNQPTDSKGLLAVREKGKWRTLCVKYGCEKGDKSVFLQNDEGELTLDFRFKTISFLKNPTETTEKIERDGKCEIIE